MNKTESYCYQKYKPSSNNSCVIKEKNIVGKNLLEGTYFDGNGIPKMIGITEAEYLEYKKLQQENEQLKCNWNKLKEWVNKQYNYYISEEDYIGGRLCFTDMKDKMQEIEKGSDSNE